MTVQVYIAARYERREEMAAHAAELEAIGGTSTARWLSGAHEALDAKPDFAGRAPEFALEDLDDIDESDWLVLFTDPPGTPSRGGRHFEFGYAYAMSEFDFTDRFQLALIGPPENVFHWLPRVWRFETWGDFLRHISPVPIEVAS